METGNWGLTVRPDGQIETLNGAWYSFREAEEYPLRPVSQAFEELRTKGRGGPSIEPRRTVTITTVEPRLQLWNIQRDGEGHYDRAVPAYRFVGVDSDGAPFEALILAVEPE